MMYDHRFKRFRDFILTYQMKDNEFSKRVVKVKARSSVEAGLIILMDNLIPFNCEAVSLLDSSETFA